METIIFIICFNCDPLQVWFIIQEDILLGLAFEFEGFLIQWFDFCTTSIDHNLVNFHPNGVVIFIISILSTLITSFLFITKSKFEWKSVYFGKTLQVVFSSYWFWAKLQNIITPSIFGYLSWLLFQRQYHNHCEHFIFTHPRPIMNEKWWIRSIYYRSFCQLHYPITFSFFTQIICVFFIQYHFSIIYNFHSFYKG